MNEEIQRSLGRIEGKLDAHTEDLKELKVCLVDYGKRITILEMFKNKMVIYISFGSFIVLTGIEYLKKRLWH